MGFESRKFVLTVASDLHLCCPQATRSDFFALKPTYAIVAFFGQSTCFAFMKVEQNYSLDRE